MDYGYECVVTSVVDGKHSHGSLHYAGYAMDLRTRHLTPTDQSLIVSALKKALTDEFDIVLEENHIHIEYQPKC
jgi:hypothetical protein